MRRIGHAGASGSAALLALAPLVNHLTPNVYRFIKGVRYGNHAIVVRNSRLIAVYTRRSISAKSTSRLRGDSYFRSVCCTTVRIDIGLCCACLPYDGRNAADIGIVSKLRRRIQRRSCHGCIKRDFKITVNHPDPLVGPIILRRGISYANDIGSCQCLCREICIDLIFFGYGTVAVIRDMGIGIIRIVDCNISTTGVVYFKEMDTLCTICGSDGTVTPDTSSDRTGIFARECLTRNCLNRTSLNRDIGTAA